MKLKLKQLIARRAKIKRAVAYVAGGVLLLSAVGVGHSEAAAPLSEEHKKWLREEVVYIISDDEKELFKNLNSDAEREQFIKQFWLARDPTPGTPENEFKQEHYRRIEYANHYFGFDQGKEGWRTDRGRIYIQLGEPQQRIQHRWLGEIRPLELWFYSQSEHPSLPNAFSVMFFQPDSTSGYRLYSPSLHGPDKLVKRTGAENDPRGSYYFLRDFNPEIARASLTLLTDEPVDPQRGPSLASDSLLTRIHNIPNDKFTKEKLERRRRLYEAVETRIIYEPSEMEVLTVPFRDSQGVSYLHFLLYLRDALKEMVPKDRSEKPLVVTVSVLVRDSQGEKLFQQEHQNRYSFKDNWGWQQDLPVGYEGLLPLPVGEYNIDFVVRNELTQALYQKQQHVKVPAVEELQLSPIVPYDEVFKAKDSQTPTSFQVSDFKFGPRIEKKFGTSEELQVFFQIVDPSAGPDSSPEDVLRVEYTLGSLTGGHRESHTETISKREFTDEGVVLHGKAFSLSEFPAGSYRLVVTVSDPTTPRRASKTMPFRVVPGSIQSKVVRLMNQEFEKDLDTGMLSYRRALCELAHGRTEEGTQYLQEALAVNPRFHAARNQLVATYFKQEEFEKVAALYPEEELTGDTDFETLRRFITSFEKIGQLDKAIQVAERTLSLWGPRRALYKQLAHLFEQAGQPERADEMRSYLESSSNP